MRINVLSPGFTTSNGSAFLFPLVVHRQTLKDAGFDIRFVKRSDPELTCCDLLAIDSKEFRKEWRVGRNQTIDLIQSYTDSSVAVAWFDTTDGTGTLQSSVIPIVDAYCKAQLLVDRKRYNQHVYGGRVHSDFYHANNGVIDDDGQAEDEPVSTDDISKLHVSWNSGLADYSTYGPFWVKLYQKLGISKLLRYRKPYSSPTSPRNIQLSARFGATYSKASVRYQREQMREILAARLDTKKLGRRQYMKELQDSKVVASPYGWGEITLKDFEVFLTGGLLLKPSMDHMQTWPDFYRPDETYLPHKWDLSDLEQQIDWALDHETDRIRIAGTAQQIYESHTSGSDASEIFVNHFSSLMSSITGSTN